MHTNQFSNLFLFHGYTKIIHKPTRVQGNRQSLIDSIYTHMSFKENTKTGIILTSFSDHYSPFCVFNDFNHLNNGELKLNIYKISFCDKICILLNINLIKQIVPMMFNSVLAHFKACFLLSAAFQNSFPLKEVQESQ